MSADPPDYQHAVSVKVENSSQFLAEANYCVHLMEKRNVNPPIAVVAVISMVICRMTIAYQNTCAKLRRQQVHIV
jgi:hypothetical protein